MTGVEVRRADDRACTRTDWLTSWHSFSYGEHYDPDNVGFGPLVVSNHDVLGPGAGFDQHRHADVDLVTLVVAGSLEHRDSEGHSVVLGAGDLQVLQAGRGVEHSERNGSDVEPVEYVQMWLRSPSTTVSYDRPVGGVILARGALRVVELTPGQAYELIGGGLAHGYLLRGTASFGDGETIGPGDAVRLRGTTVEVVAETHSIFLAWSLRKV